MITLTENTLCGSAAFDSRKRKMDIQESAADSCQEWWSNTISADELAEVIRTQALDEILLVDCRSFIEFNQSNIYNSINVCCNKMMKRRLQQNKLKVEEFLATNCQMDLNSGFAIIIYDSNTKNTGSIPSDSMIHIIGEKASTAFRQVLLLQGGYHEFSERHPSLIENKSATPMPNAASCLSQPCMSVANVGPTKITPYLFLGSMKDALNAEVAKANGITYVLNVSMTCPKPTHIQDGHFLRIPVNDNYSEKLLPYFHDAFKFIDKVREANCCVLVHCLAGVSRSATLAIAYMMKTYHMTSEEAYRYVKDKRVSISPNFNFLGQLLEYEKEISLESTQPSTTNKRRCIDDLRADLASPSSSLAAPKLPRSQSGSVTAVAHSPTTALSKLKFDTHYCHTAPAKTGANSPTNAFSRLKFCTVPEKAPLTPQTATDQVEFMQCFPAGPSLLNSNSNNNTDSLSATNAMKIKLQNPRRPFSLGIQIPEESASSEERQISQTNTSSLRIDMSVARNLSPASGSDQMLFKQPASPILMGERSPSRPKQTAASTPSTPTTHSIELRANLDALIASGVDTRRLSRSLEDVMSPSSAADATCIKCNNFNKKCPCHQSQTEMVMGASSSSISSNGSHSSLHGSHEIFVS